MQINYEANNRIGDHIWWVSDVRKFQSHYPEWSYKYNLDAIVGEMISKLQERIQ